MGILDSIPNELLVLLKDQGLTFKQIADTLGVGVATVHREFNKRKLIDNDNKLRDIPDEELIKYRRDKNLTYEQIGELLGVSGNTVSKEYSDRGIRIKLKSNRALKDISDNELKIFRDEGLSYTYIANKLNVSRSLVVKEYSIRGLVDGSNNRKVKIADIENNVLSKLRADGNSYESIAEILDVSLVTIHKEYSKRGLKDSQ